MLTPEQREELVQLEECLLRAQNAANALRQKAAECKQDYDLRGTICVNLHSLRRKCLDALVALGDRPQS